MGNPFVPITVCIIEFLSWVMVVYSFIYCLKPGSPDYMRIFPIYAVVNCIPFIVTWFWPQSWNMVIKLFTIFELIFFTFFFSKVIQSRKKISIMWQATTIFAVVLLVDILDKNLVKTNRRLVITECFILILGGLFYFIDLFRAPKFIDLLKSPAFWMVIGILFYVILLVPTVLFSYYFYHYGEKVMGSNIYLLNSCLQIVSYALYVKGMTCIPNLS